MKPVILTIAANKLFFRFYKKRRVFRKYKRTSRRVQGICINNIIFFCCSTIVRFGNFILYGFSVTSSAILTYHYPVSNSLVNTENRLSNGTLRFGIK